jgi:hypothetical protein
MPGADHSINPQQSEPKMREQGVLRQKRLKGEHHSPVLTVISRSEHF